MTKYLDMAKGAPEHEGNGETSHYWSTENGSEKSR